MHTNACYSKALGQVRTNGFDHFPPARTDLQQRWRMRGLHSRPRRRDDRNALALVPQLALIFINEAFVGGDDTGDAFDQRAQMVDIVRARAEQRVKFFNQYRSYVINYNLGKDLVRAFIEKRTKNDRSPRKKWSEFAALLSSPRLPSGLK